MRRQHATAMAIAKEFVEEFVIGEYAIAGSLRRKEPTVGDVDLIVNEDLDVIRENVLGNHHVKIINGGDMKMDLDYKGMRFNIYFSELASWGAMLFFLTGPARYQIAYRRRAKERGMKLDQYGLWKGKELIASRTEAHIYKALGKEYKEPHLRGK